MKKTVIFSNSIFLLVLISIAMCFGKSITKNKTPNPIHKKQSTQEISKGKKRTITVANNIDEKMLTYAHWTGSYKPSAFKIQFNGYPIELGGKKKIPIAENSLTVRYDYSFLNGLRKGAKEIELSVNEKTDTLNVTFSWNEKWHILADGATAKTMTELPFDKKLLTI